ncbi:MAG: thiamine phosphate synthase [Burkholderiaceae bacterium]|nr:thiamine phosphate synthase [Burkholderiaceae bacterium]
MTPELARIAGVYLLTPDSAARGFDAVLAVVQQALDAGVRAVQYRDKTADAAQRRDRASRLSELTRATGALLIVNDSIEAAISSGADGVHLGSADGDVADARDRLPHQLLGVSCYNQFDRARAAIAAGADAVAFGSMFESATKPAAVRAPLALLSAARAAWPQRRIIAIGGINAANIATVAAAGAHAAAVLGAVFATDRPAQAVGELIHRFDQGRVQHEQGRVQ